MAVSTAFCYPTRRELHLGVNNASSKRFVKKIRNRHVTAAVSVATRAAECRTQTSSPLVASASPTGAAMEPTRVLAIMLRHNGIIWSIIGVLQTSGITGHNAFCCQLSPKYSRYVAVVPGPARKAAKFRTVSPGFAKPKPKIACGAEAIPTPPQHFWLFSAREKNCGQNPS